MSADDVMRAAPKTPIRTGAPRPDTAAMLAVDPTATSTAGADVGLVSVRP